MNLDRYSYQIGNDHQDYIFYSEWPKGKIKKKVRFSKMPDLEVPVYNLGFGYELNETGVVDDSIVTNNKDSDRVLATVANTIIDFSKLLWQSIYLCHGEYAIKNKVVSNWYSWIMGRNQRGF